MLFVSRRRKIALLLLFTLVLLVDGRSTYFLGDACLDQAYAHHLHADCAVVSVLLSSEVPYIDLLDGPFGHRLHYIGTEPESPTMLLDRSIACGRVTLLFLNESHACCLCRLLLL
jgi:hypothetical protein